MDEHTVSKELKTSFMAYGSGKQYNCLGVSLHGGIERPLCKAVEVNPGLPWRLQDVGVARVYTIPAEESF